MAYGFYSGSGGFINLFPIIKIAVLVYVFGEDGLFILCQLFAVFSIMVLIWVLKQTYNESGLYGERNE